MWSFMGFIGVTLAIMSKLKRQVDLLQHALLSHPAVSSPVVPGTLCFKLNREPLYFQYPPTKLLLHSLSQLKAHSQILQAY